MRLELLTTFTLAYDTGGLLLVRPFAGSEAQGFGTGTGEAVGERLHGPIRWSNYPRMNDAGVLMPDARGVITTDGGPVLFEFRGYSIGATPDAPRRTVTAAVTFRTEVDEHRWLNTAIAVHDGTIDFTTMTTEFPTYVCVPTSVA